jgi:hypothetical protein
MTLEQANSVKIDSDVSCSATINYVEKELRGRRKSDKTPLSPLEEFALREIYVKVLNYAVEQGVIYHLYDLWRVLSEVLGPEGKEDGWKATRGFYLDLWDLYGLKVHGVISSQSDGSREDELLRCYVCLMHSQFEVLLSAPDVATRNVWQRRVASIIEEIAKSDDGIATDKVRKLLYSITYLYTSLYPDPTVSEGSEALARQLRAAEAAEQCTESPDAILINPQTAFGEGSGTEVHEKSKDDFVKIFFLIYRSLSHFERIGLRDLVTSLQKSLPDSAPSLKLGRLLRHWAAVMPFFKIMLLEKTGFEFRKYASRKSVHLPSYHGSDNYICVIGVRSVGKTHFLFASEAASRDDRVPTLYIRHVDNETEVDRFRNIWNKGVELPDDELKNFATQDTSIYAETNMRGLCRYTFYDIPGEELKKVNRHGASDWLEEHFRTRRPCAVLIMVDQNSIDSQAYGSVADLLSRFLVSSESSYRSLPIYFVINKIDHWAPPGNEAGRRFSVEMARFLNAKEQLRPGFVFPSIRGEQGMNTAANVLDALADTEVCCRNLAFTELLARDIGPIRLGPLIDQCLTEGFTNLSIAYTNCLRRKDGDSDYGSITALWDDLSSFIADSTVSSRKAYYRHAFVDQPRDHFKLVDEFIKSATVSSVLSLRDEDAKKLIDLPNAQLLADFSAIQNRGKRFVGEVLPLASGFQKVDKFFSEFEERKVALAAEVEKAVGRILEELGVPADLPVSKLSGFEQLARPIVDALAATGTTSEYVARFQNSKYYKPLPAEFEKRLVDAVKGFNADDENKSTPLTVDTSAIAEVIGRIPNLIQSLEATSRRGVNFDKRRGALNTLCPYKDRKTSAAEKNTLFGHGVDVTVLEVLKRVHDPLTEESVARLLKDYSPRYPQFAFNLFDKDWIKARVIEQVRNGRNDLEDQLIPMTSILLGISHQLSDQAVSSSALRGAYQAKYLLSLLHAQNYNVAAFEANPREMIQHILTAKNQMESAKASGGWLGTGIGKKQADQNKALVEFNTAYAYVKRNPNTYVSSKLDEQAETIVAELDAANDIFGLIRTLVTPDDQIKGLSSYAAKSYALTKMGDYGTRLKKYEEGRKYLLLQERAEYLLASNWLAGQKQEYMAFIEPALSPSAFRSRAPDPTTITPEVILEVFQKGIEELCERDELWTWNGGVS